MGYTPMTGMMSLMTTSLRIEPQFATILVGNLPTVSR